MSETEWRECDDPVELAAAAAAGVEVQVLDRSDHVWGPVAEVNRTLEAFRLGVEHIGFRFRLPAGWSPDVPPADDLRERRVWTCKIGGRVGRLPAGADLPMRRAVADAFTAETGHPVEFCFSGWGDDLDESELAVVENREPDPEVIRAALVKRLTTLPGGSPTPAPPAPPWPGAVLSGLVDEDGVPTWLAQAGNVRGGQVRACTDVGWERRHHADADWVEVRAPRPAPATERVPVWESVGRKMWNGQVVTNWQACGDAESKTGSVIYGPNEPCFCPDGTVEVLKDGGQ